MVELVVRNLCKYFGAVKAVHDITFEIRDGELVTLLGPSGCGKSTTLAAVAGLDRPTSGLIRAGDDIFFDSDRNINRKPEQRNCGLVFQSYALWPHLKVRQNVDFPLSLRKVSKADRQRRINEALELVEMLPYADRYPHELSGGQQQRVALARTIVYRPSVLLLDEPLSNLDAKLRERAREWLSQLQHQVGLTTLYVTHDQIEALALSDRIVVMHGGRIVQVGTPREIYEQPATPFVADFIGTSSFLSGIVENGSQADVTVVKLLDGTRINVPKSKFAEGLPVTVAVRPESLSIAKNLQAAPLTPHLNVLKGSITTSSYLGARYQYKVAVGDSLLKIETPEIVTDLEVGVWVPMESLSVFERSATPLTS